jgi:hypothetical protein
VQARCAQASTQRALDAVQSAVRNDALPVAGGGGAAWGAVGGGAWGGGGRRRSMMDGIPSLPSSPVIICVLHLDCAHVLAYVNHLFSASFRTFVLVS